MKKSSKIILTSCLAFLLVATIVISTVASSRTAKAEIIDTNRRFTLNANTTFDFASYATSTSTRVYLQDIDSNPFVFGVNTNDYLDDNLTFSYFAISVRKVQTNRFSVSIHPYNGVNHTISTTPVDSFIYDYSYQMYICDFYGLFDDDPEDAQINVTSLFNQGFYLVRGLALPDNQLSKGYDQIEGGSVTYFAFRNLLITSYNEGDGYQSGFDDGATSEYNKIIGNPTLYGLYPENTVRQNYYNGYTAGLNASSNAFSRFGDILRTSWNSATNILNTQVFGSLTILHLISIPLLLGLFLIVLKLIRG